MFECVVFFSLKTVVEICGIFFYRRFRGLYVGRRTNVINGVLRCVAWVGVCVRECVCVLSWWVSLLFGMNSLELALFRCWPNERRAQNDGEYSCVWYIMRPMLAVHATRAPHQVSWHFFRSLTLFMYDIEHYFIIITGFRCSHFFLLGKQNIWMNYDFFMKTTLIDKIDECLISMKINKKQNKRHALLRCNAK